MCVCVHTGALSSFLSLSLSSFDCLIFTLCSRGYSSAAHLTFLNLQHRFSSKCGKTHFFVFYARPFNLHQMRLVPKYRYSSPKWLTEICTFIIKCDTKLVQALSWMEGLTEMGAVNPFICVRPRKEGRIGLGPQNGMALSPLQTRHHQPCEHELHVLRRTRGCWCLHFHIFSISELASKPAQTGQCLRCTTLPEKSSLRGWDEGAQSLRLIKFASSLVEVQHQAFVCGSH